jgi:hypothetical protein
MIGRLLCRLFGHPPIRVGSIYGACHRCGEMIRGRAKDSKVTFTSLANGETRILKGGDE